VVTQTYTGRSQVVTRGYDTLDRLIAATDWLKIGTDFGYNANGNAITEAYSGSHGERE
jgi:YD repeat-containing protein